MRVPIDRDQKPVEKDVEGRAESDNKQDQLRPVAELERHIEVLGPQRRKEARYRHPGDKLRDRTDELRPDEEPSEVAERSVMRRLLGRAARAATRSFASRRSTSAGDCASAEKTSG